MQHLYRTVGFLAEVREELERELFFRDRDLFSEELDLVFIDTTSTFVWRDEATALRRRGHFKDRRPEQPQVLVCVAVDAHSWPIGWDILPGNISDGKAFVAMIERLRKRFRIARVTVVAGRGMIATTLRLAPGGPSADHSPATSLGGTPARVPTAHAKHRTTAQARPADRSLGAGVAARVWSTLPAFMVHLPLLTLLVQPDSGGAPLLAG